MFKEILDEIMLYEPKTNKINEIIILVGLPGSGKDTFLTENSLRDSHTIISRDDELVKYCEENNIKGNYNEQWKLLSDAEHKIIDNNTYSKFISAVKNKENIIINEDVENKFVGNPGIIKSIDFEQDSSGIKTSFSLTIPSIFADEDIKEKW